MAQVYQVNSSSSGGSKSQSSSKTQSSSNYINTQRADDSLAVQIRLYEQRKAIALKAKQKKKPVMKTNIFGQRYCVKKKKGSNLTGSDGRKWKAMARKNWDAALF